VATSTPARPLLRLASPPSATAGPATVARAESQAASPRGFRTAPTSGTRIAQATGALLRREDEGRETVVFPPPAGRAFAPAISVMREADSSAPNSNDQGQPDPGSAPPAAPPAAAPAPPPAQGGGGGGDIEEIYTQVIDRLRRDLLADRERMGDVLGDLP
jgi:hypothetical protein